MGLHRDLVVPVAEQPAWQPPGAVFGLAWTYNFIALGVVGVAMSLAPPGRVATFLVALGVTIVLAVAWAYLFYVPHAWCRLPSR